MSDMSVIIRLQKLPLTANASDVRSFFKGLSIPDGGVHIVGGEMGDAFIAFSTDEDARQAMALNGGKINNEPISLLLSSRAEMQKIIEQARKAALTYMQLARGVAPVAASGLAMATRPKVGHLPEVTPARPAQVAQAVPPIGSGVSKYALAGSSMVSAAASALKLQPPVISLAGYLAQAQTSIKLDNIPQLSALKTVTVPSTSSSVMAPSVAAAPSTLSPLLSQGSAYSEIPGLSFLSSSTGSTHNGAGGANNVAEADLGGSVPSLSTNGFAGLISALRGGPFSQPVSAENVNTSSLYLNGGGIDTSFLANNVTPLNLKGTPQLMPDANNQSPWKFLKKDRRSRSPSRERPGVTRRSALSRSTSRDRDVKRNRRSRSSSRGRSFRRSRSSSRDRGSRSWSRSPSREYNRRSSRNSRSRSSSRDRFGRTRQRSRSRSLRDHRSRDRSSRDRSRDRNGRGRFASSSGGRGSGGRAREGSPARQNQQHVNPWNTADPIFTGSSLPAFSSTMAGRQAEPIFGLHTTLGGGGMASQDPRARQGLQGAAALGGGHFLPTRSGKISPPPPTNSAMGGGGHFRNMSPLPESVYSGVPQPPFTANNSDKTTSDYAVKVSNLDTVTGYGELRRFFKSLLISTQGIKMINDQNGRRTGVAYIQFLRKEGKWMALQRNGSQMRRRSIWIESITDQEFEQACDSFRPGTQQQQQQQQQCWDDQGSDNGAPWNNGRSGDGAGPWNGGGSGGGGGGGIDSNDDFDEQGKASSTNAPTSALVVWNLPTFTTEQDIMKMFSDFTVVEVLIVKHHSIPKQLDGYVRFHRQEDAKEAWSQVHRHYIGNKRVAVRMCPEIDYEVAKNEYENPPDTEPNAEETQEATGGGSPSDGGESRQQEEHDGNDKANTGGQESPQGSRGGESDNQQDGYGKNKNERAEQRGNGDGGGGGGGGNDRRRAGGAGENARGQNNRNNGNGGRGSGSGRGARKKRWDTTEKNWDDEESLRSMMIEAQRQMEADAGGGSDTSASWMDRDPRMMMRGRDNNSPSNDSNNYNGNGGGFGNNYNNNGGNNNNNNNNHNNNNNNNNHNNNNSLDPRIWQSGSGSGRGGGGRFGGDEDSVDNIELFQRTTCLLLRNVDANVCVNDVVQFFAQDGFRTKEVLLVSDNRGQRTGECLVEFETPGEAAHAESKSSHELGRCKVFASHLDRGQVREMMRRLNEHQQPSSWQSDGPFRRGDGGDGRRSANDRYDDPEDHQGVGCGPYRTTTVGLLNLAYRTTVDDVRNFFREFNLPSESIQRKYLDNGQPTGEAVVHFRNRMEAEKALNEYQNRKLFSRNVRIRLINDN